MARCAATRGAVLRRWSGLCARIARGEGGRTSLLVRLSVAMIEADEPDAVGPASSTRSCRICRYTYKTGTSGHNAKNCALNDMHCRAQEPPASPYHVTGPCLSGSCSHNMTCTVCHKLGHSNATQRYTPIRWRMKKGTLARSDHQPALSGADLVCDFLKDSDVKQIVENCVNAATEAAFGKARDTGVSLKLRAKMHEACLTGDEVVALMLAHKSKASGLSEQNLPTFRLVRQHRKKGAIAANEAAARELESRLDGSEDSLSDSSSCGGRGRRGSSRTVVRPSRSVKDRMGKSGRQARALASANAIVKRRSSVSGRGGGGGGGGSSSHRSPSQRPPRGRPPSVSLKGKGVKVLKTDDVLVASDSRGSADGGRGWPPGAWARFSELLQPVSWAPFASLTPTGLVDAVLVAACQLPIEQTDEEVRRLMLKGAMESGLRGFMVS